MRLKKMPAPTSQAARAPDPPDGRVGSVSSVTTRDSGRDGGWRLGRPARRERAALVATLDQQPLQELPLVVEPPDLGREPLDLALEGRDPVGEQVVRAGERASLDPGRERAP